MEVRGDHIVAFRGLFWRQEAATSAELMRCQCAKQGELCLLTRRFW